MSDTTEIALYVVGGIVLLPLAVRGLIVAAYLAAAVPALVVAGALAFLSWMRRGA